MLIKQDDYSCPFCKSDIAENTFIDNGHYLAVYNIAPVLPGHSLIIPRDHKTSIFELSETELFDFIRFSRNTIKILQQAFKTDAFDWILQEKEESGQSIAHMHIHIIPRKKNDLSSPGDWYPLFKKNTSMILDTNLRQKINTKDMKIIVNKLKQVASELNLLQK